MKKWQKANLMFFFIIVFILAVLTYLRGCFDFSSPLGKPWHLQPSVHEDSLSQTYLNKYRILNKRSLYGQFYDSTRVNIFILVDAWGVPIDEKLMDGDFSFFNDIPHVYAIHQRLANRTKHAERVELRNRVQNAVYLFGGDSLEYNRQAYLKELGFNSSLFCQYCKDSVMLFKIDSLLANDSLKLIAWTTQSSRLGNRDSLQKSLSLIADFVQRHPNVNVVVQGTHRPILGTPEVRRMYKAHWVPTAILNVKEFADMAL